MTLGHLMDCYRRLLGRAWDLAGLGPRETPYRVVARESGLCVRQYLEDGHAAPILLVPAPIKRPYIWDLLPEVSVVRRLQSRGLQVFLLDWETPGRGKRGLSQYADQGVSRAVQVVRERTHARRVFLAGHSLGGTLAAIFATLHPETLQGLLLVGTPLHFAPDTDAFTPWVRLIPAGMRLSLGNDVPGSLLDLAAFGAAPAEFGWDRWLDQIRSLDDRQALRIHACVERWSLDETSMPRRLFEEVVNWLYREDRFCQGTLRVGGRRALPSRIDMPLLCVVERRSPVASPESILPLLRLVGSRDQATLWYAGEIGVSLQHVGLLVGRTAHHEIWPKAAEWLMRHG